MKGEQRRVLVTGAGGFIGHHLVTHLKKEGLWVRGVDIKKPMFEASPADEFTKMEVLPYLALGVGAKWHNPAGDAYTCRDTQENKTWSCAPFTVGSTTGTWRTARRSFARPAMYWPADTPLIGPVST